MAKPPLQAAVISDGGLHNLDEMDDRVKLVDMLDGASDAACLAVLHRLDALPVPIKSIIKLVAKKLARVRKHETRAVADAASALIQKWCAHYNSTAPPVAATKTAGEKRFEALRATTPRRRRNCRRSQAIT